MSIITADNLTKRYGPRVGVDRIALNVTEGEIFGFLGPNGAGKTTAIRVLLGFLRPTSGTARVIGMDCWRKSHLIKRDVGYLPGDLRLYPWMTLRSGLAIVGRVRGMDLTAAGRDLADRFQLEPGVRLRRMSRGMRQKVGIILALAHKPRLLILDEPTSGLDPLMQDELASCLRELAAAGHTVFFSSHTLKEVERLCDRVAIVRRGRIAADESLVRLREQALRDVTLTFRDASTANETTPPDFLTVTRRHGAVWRCDFSGKAPALIEWSASQPIADLVISPPDLETLFRRYYRKEEEEADEADEAVRS